MGRGRRLGLRATVLVIVVIAATAVGILTPTLSNSVEKDVNIERQAIVLTVEGVPTTVAAGEFFRVVATMSNQANRPIPAVLRLEARNPNSTTPGELTVYAGCGAEEVVSTRTLRYYIGWHGPLLAPRGTSFPEGTTVAAVLLGTGGADYWAVAENEIRTRDPAGYASLIHPGTNASIGVRNSGDEVLKILYYYGMVASANEGSANPGEWVLTMPFSDRIVADGDGSQDGFLVEIHPQARGSFELKFWAERPDALGMPNEPTYACGPL
ncbi:MAG: hypothetical protein A3K68_00465 [Euryarchaeota archaeon RBG_16_68_13]|nr:MAG: hypothetical protein A3K68_00465 [Euryarchaeota archaeon RBG_16_68_13]